MKDRKFRSAQERSKTGPTDSDKEVVSGTPATEVSKGERIAKVMARSGLCSRRDAERWIEEGRVKVNGTVLTSPALSVSADDKIFVDGKPMPQRERTRLWLYHKPKGVVTTNKDPEGRRTVFQVLPPELPRVMTIGRLDINTEGLLLLTNDGGLARVLELPDTGWTRRYRVRVRGVVDPAKLLPLRDGLVVEGMIYGSIEATLDRVQGGNSWLTIGLREGKNREIKNILGFLGYQVNRLIRLSYGPFQLHDLNAGTAIEVRSKLLREQLGAKLIEEAGADFESEKAHVSPQREEAESKPRAKKAFDRTKTTDQQRDAEKKGRDKVRPGKAASSSRGPKRDGRARQEREETGQGEKWAFTPKRSQKKNDASVKSSQRPSQKSSSRSGGKPEQRGKSGGGRAGRRR